MAKSDSFMGAIRRFFSDYLTAMGERGSFGELVRKAAQDAELRRRLLESPDAVLAEAGIKLPSGITVTVVENTEQTIHLVLPPLVADDVREGEKV